MLLYLFWKFKFRAGTPKAAVTSPKIQQSMILIRRLLSRLFGLFWLDFLVYLGYSRLHDHAWPLRGLAWSNSASCSLNKLKNLTRKGRKVSSRSLLINNIPLCCLQQKWYLARPCYSLLLPIGCISICFGCHTWCQCGWYNMTNS